MQEEKVVNELTDNEQNILYVVWGLHLASLLCGGLTSIAAVIISYIKKDDSGPIAQTHHKASIRTFWWALFWFIVGYVLLLVLIGFPILAAVIIWLAYKSIKGLVRISEKKAY